jgi:hypothetical protein
LEAQSKLPEDLDIDTLSIFYYIIKILHLNLKDILIKSIDGISNEIIKLDKELKYHETLYEDRYELYTKAVAEYIYQNNSFDFEGLEEFIENINKYISKNSVPPVRDGGYNNKSGEIDYHICKANFKQPFKKVSAKSSREAAKIIAMKVLKGNKKSAKFSLKRIIGKKEKCYDYNISIDKSGKLIIIR